MNASQRVSLARVRLLERAPFFGALALRLALSEQSADDCPTMAVDGVSLFYSVAFVDSVSDLELLGVVCHEVLHCAYRHFARRGNRDATQWNYAADYALNPAVIAAGFTLPQGCLIDAKYDGMSAETIYDLLERDKRAGKPSPGNGQAQPGEVRDMPKQDANGQPIDATELDGQWSDAVKQAIGVANRRAQAGQAMSGLDAFKAGAGATRVDWRYELSKFTDFSAFRDQDWTRPNRRYAWQGLSLPSLVPVRPSCVLFMIDTSGSMDTEALADITAEAQAALDANSVDQLVMIYANTRVQRVDAFYPGDTITDGPSQGSGGTDFDDSFEYAAREYPDASAIVYLTDGGTSSWGADPGCPVLWALTVPAQWAGHIVPPFGDKLPLL